MKEDLSPYSIHRQLLLFFGLTYALTWLIWSPYFLPLGIAVDKLPYVHLLGSLGPMLAALLVTIHTRGFSGIRALFGRVTSRRGYVRWLGVAFLAPLMMLLLIAGFVCVTQHRTPDWHRLFSSGEFSFLPPSIYVVVNIAIVGLGEEVGWRGFVLPRLQIHYSAFTSTLLLTLFWAIWHWPLFLNPLGTYNQMEAGSFIGWLFSLLAGGLLFTWLYNSSRGNVLACALFHGLMDVVFMADLNLPGIATYTGVLVTFWGFYIGFVYKPIDLSRFPRVTLFETTAEEKPTYI
ncbi:CPBP family intramembrane glutamic endopeptidase [Spirosoma koreense]